MISYVLICLVLILCFGMLLKYILSFQHAKPKGMIDETEVVYLENDEHPLVEKRIEALVNEVRETTYSLWAALLTINGVIATVFSLFSISQLNQNWFVFFLSLATILCALSSSYLLIQNYILSRNWREQAKTSLRRFLESEEIPRSDIKTILASPLLNQIELSEKWAIRLLYTEALLVMVVYVVSAMLKLP